MRKVTNLVTVTTKSFETLFLGVGTVLRPAFARNVLPVQTRTSIG